MLSSLDWNESKGVHCHHSYSTLYWRIQAVEFGKGEKEEGRKEGKMAGRLKGRKKETVIDLQPPIPYQEIDS